MNHDFSFRCPLPVPTQRPSETQDRGTSAVPVGNLGNAASTSNRGKHVLPSDLHKCLGCERELPLDLSLDRNLRKYRHTCPTKIHVGPPLKRTRTDFSTYVSTQVPVSLPPPLFMLLTLPLVLRRTRSRCRSSSSPSIVIHLQVLRWRCVLKVPLPNANTQRFSGQTHHEKVGQNPEDMLLDRGVLDIHESEVCINIPYYFAIVYSTISRADRS
jgi:hypothetical protein